jgi:hypothetical protein
MSPRRATVVERFSNSLSWLADSAAAFRDLRADKVKRIKLASVNGIRQRFAHLLLWLERRAPDIACLQELKAPAW